MKLLRLSFLALVALTLAAGGARAQEEKPAAPEPKPAPEEKPAPKAEPRRDDRTHTQKVVTVKNVERMDALRTLLRGYPVQVNAVDQLGVFVLGGRPEAVAAAEQALQRFDVPGAPRTTREHRAAPQRNADFTAYLVLARPDDGPGSPMPETLSPVVEQLRTVFPYKRYDLVETLAVRVADRSSGEVSGILPPLGNIDARTFYKLYISQVAVAGKDDGGPSARGLVGLSVEVPQPASKSAPEAFQYRSVEIKTALDVREGQKVVVGKSAFDGTRSSLILVLTVKVVE